MKSIPLNKGYSAVVDDEDYDKLSTYKWRADIYRGVSYAMRSEVVAKYRYKQISMHRQLLKEPNCFVDHIDGDTLNNQKSNLRLATIAQNNCNRKISKSNKSGYPGVFWVQRLSKWRVDIKNNGKREYLGFYSSKEEAIQVKAKKTIELKKEFSPSYVKDTYAKIR